MICPMCGSDDNKVKDSRTIGDGTVRRRRYCNCGIRFTTYELTAEEYEKMKQLEEIAIKLKEVIDDDWQRV